MTELPPELQHIGVGARTFKKSAGPEKGDRSIWTDTPADRARKVMVSYMLIRITETCVLCVSHFGSVHDRSTWNGRKRERRRQTVSHKSLRKIWKWQRK